MVLFLAESFAPGRSADQRRVPADTEPYVEVPAGQFGNFNLKGLIHQALGSVVKIAPAVTSSTVNGQQAYRLTDTLKGGYLYVAKSGTHYPIEVTQPGSGVLTFSEWNSVAPISAPPASQVVSLPAGTG